MKKIERILIKIIIIQFILLFFVQIFFHQMELFPQLKQLTKYEGVNNFTYSEIIQTFNGQ